MLFTLIKTEKIILYTWNYTWYKTSYWY